MICTRSFVEVDSEGENDSGYSMGDDSDSDCETGKSLFPSVVVLQCLQLLGLSVYLVKYRLCASIHKQCACVQHCSSATIACMQALEVAQTLACQAMYMQLTDAHIF
jgi:hypothetical protein